MFAFDRPAALQITSNISFWDAGVWGSDRSVASGENGTADRWRFLARQERDPSRQRGWLDGTRQKRRWEVSLVPLGGNNLRSDSVHADPIWTEP
jgi:hypothetical protein